MDDGEEDDEVIMLATPDVCGNLFLFSGAWLEVCLMVVMYLRSLGGTSRQHIIEYLWLWGDRFESICGLRLSVTWLDLALSTAIEQGLLCSSLQDYFSPLNVFFISPRGVYHMLELGDVRGVVCQADSEVLLSTDGSASIRFILSFIQRYSSHLDLTLYSNHISNGVSLRALANRLYQVRMWRHPRAVVGHTPCQRKRVRQHVQKPQQEQEQSQQQQHDYRRKRPLVRMNDLRSPPWLRVRFHRRKSQLPVEQQQQPVAPLVCANNPNLPPGTMADDTADIETGFQDGITSHQEEGVMLLSPVSLSSPLREQEYHQGYISADDFDPVPAPAAAAAAAGLVRRCWVLHAEEERGAGQDPNQRRRKHIKSAARRYK